MVTIRSRSDSSVNGSNFGRIAMNVFRKFRTEGHQNQRETAITTSTTAPAPIRKRENHDLELESESESEK